MAQQQLVVIGNGMVGHRFIEKLIEFDAAQRYCVTTFCEESRAAYDRVGLTSFFAHRDAERLMIARLEWYQEHGIQLHLGDRACRIDRRRRLVTSDQGARVAYDLIVLASGSYPFVPPVEGIQKPGVFAYRTIQNLEEIAAYGQRASKCAVLGGGLLGLEAAKAAYDLGLETHVVEAASRLMPRQLDENGARVLKSKLEALGVRIHLGKSTRQVIGGRRVEGLVFEDGQSLDVDMIIVSAGIRPRDELARDAGIEVGERGGVRVNDRLQSSDPQIYAIGEVALHAGLVYGLVAPGYQMAEIVAANLTGGDRQFNGTDLSTKLKLMGVDVGCFGELEAGGADARSLVYEDPFAGVYRKLVFDAGGTRLLGGMLVGDAADYGVLAALAKSGGPLPAAPGMLLGGSPVDRPGLTGGDALPDQAPVCSCNHVTAGSIRQAIRDNQLTTLEQVKACTRAGSGCAGCLPLVDSILRAQLAAAGVTVTAHLCEHFSYTRQELFAIAKVQQIKTFDALIDRYGTGHGCETCKPVVGSILASLWNESIVDPQHHTLQDTNDRFLANIQRGGLYSVVPRVPGGEITPDKLIILGRIAKKFGLYTKITGGQRIDLFGAQLQQLPEIWQLLVEAGFESGHAYGKAVRTVKSCVGSTWCRYGVQDSVGFAVRLEQRYRGLRAPHKLKFAVSGCMRECAEAQSKDVGLIATEAGYDLYVCGNGGAQPRHADLLAVNLDAQTAVRYIDRFLIYYIETADKLMRTARWLEQLEGGLSHVKAVVVEDKLGICDELERRMQRLVESYACEWKAVVSDPRKRALFRQFVNSDESEPGIELVDERGQRRPVDACGRPLPLVPLQMPAARPRQQDGPPAAAETEAAMPLAGAVPRNGRRRPAQQPASRWIKVGLVDDFPANGGAAIKYGKVQIAVFNFAHRGEWYACQNMCPHKNAFVLSRGILGSVGGAPKVACPMHKKPFDLRSGQCQTGEALSIKVFPVKVKGQEVFLQLPPREQLDALLATENFCPPAPCPGHKRPPAERNSIPELALATADTGVLPAPLRAERPRSTSLH